MPNCITGKAPKLRGDGYIEYEISKEDDRGLYLKMISNKEEDGSNAAGTFTSDPIYLDKLFDRIVAKGGCFEPCDLRDVIPDGNNNDPGFVVAVLKDIRFVALLNLGWVRPRGD